MREKTCYICLHKYEILEADENDSGNTWDWHEKELFQVHIF